MIRSAPSCKVVEANASKALIARFFSEKGVWNLSEQYLAFPETSG